MEGESVMSALVTAIQGILSSDQMFANLTALIPAVGGVLVFAFTYRIIRKMISGASRGKARI